MAFLVGGANSVSGYDIDNSLRFAKGDTAYMTNATGGTSTLNTKMTLSFWTKMGNNTYDDTVGICHSYVDASNIFGITMYQDKIIIYHKSAGTAIEKRSDTIKYRDPSAWYHFVVAVDTTQGTAANRMKLYVNGVSKDISDGNATAEDATIAFTQNVTQIIGATWSGSAYQEHWDGYLSEFYCIDGLAYDADDFGETDSSGIWKPKDAKDNLTFGNNGFYLEFKNSAVGTGASDTIGADTSGEDQHFTSVNVAVVDQCTDSPTNNFATMNPIDISSPNGAEALPTFSEGNCKLTRANEGSARSTIGLPESGKWYFEVKYLDGFTDGYPQIYLTVNNTGDGQGVGFHTPSGSNYRGKNGAAGTVNNAFDGSPADDDILGFYANMDDKILIVHQNGSDFMGSGAASGIDFSSTTFATYTSGFFFVAYNSNANSSHSEEFNFGNPPFAISSGNADARGYGNFEFDPTLGGVEYYAICTKNLAVS